MMRWCYSDGGRHAAGFRGDARDCVCRAIAIAAEEDYRFVYARLNHLCKQRTASNRVSRGKNGAARNGVPREVYEPFLVELGFKWTPTMRVGSGCTVHLNPDELPPGRLIVRLSKHLCAVVDGIAYDTHNPTREGTRCVYGYFSKSDPTARGHEEG